MIRASAPIILGVHRIGPANLAAPAGPAAGTIAPAVLSWPPPKRGLDQGREAPADLVRDLHRDQLAEHLA